jgi:hypothetical protein
MPFSQPSLRSQPLIVIITVTRRSERGDINALAIDYFSDQKDRLAESVLVLKGFIARNASEGTMADTPNLRVPYQMNKLGWARALELGRGETGH